MNEISKALVCVCLRNGVEIWVEQDRAENLIGLLTAPNAPQFIKYEGRLLNRADLVGVFSASDMEEHTRRKNGQWKCPQNSWHQKKEDCACPTPEALENRRRLEEEYRQRYGEGVSPL